MLIRGACANEVINDEVLVSALFLRRDYPSLGKCNQCNKKGRGTIKVYRIGISRNSVSGFLVRSSELSSQIKGLANKCNELAQMDGAWLVDGLFGYKRSDI